MYIYIYIYIYTYTHTLVCTHWCPPTVPQYMFGCSHVINIVNHFCRAHLFALAKNICSSTHRSQSAAMHSSKFDGIPDSCKSDIRLAVDLYNCSWNRCTAVQLQ